MYSVIYSKLFSTTILTALVAVLTFPTASANPSDEMVWLDNGILRLGANLSLGGAITYIGPARSELNLVNNHDWGRQVQMSFYSGPSPYEPNGKKPKEHWAGLGWNPIQSGDCYGNRAKVLHHELKDGELHIVCQPMHWPLDNVPGECTFESWIKLDGDRVRVRGRLNNARPETTWFGAAGQELPAVYTNGVYYRLMTYTGEQPFTGGAAERITKKVEPGFPWKFWDATEHWAALVDEKDWGLGIVTPATTRYCGGFAGEEGSGGTLDAPTGYIAPLGKEELDHNIVYDFSYTLVLGDLARIRTVAKEEAQLTAPPVWTFSRDRQSWTYTQARDQGWPIEGFLKVRGLGEAPRMLSPVVFWRAEAASHLLMEVANSGEERSLRVCWRQHGREDFSEAEAVGLKVASHADFREYRIPLAGNPGYEGGMLQLRIEVGGAGDTDGTLLHVKSIRLFP